MGPDRWFLTFAASVFVFHQVPGFAGKAPGDAIGVVAPFVVAGASAGVIAAFGWPRGATILAFVAGLLYVHGLGVHVSANSINNEHPAGSVERIADFWDERFSHIESTIGWFGLVGSFCLAERAVPVQQTGRAALATAAALLGWTFFTSTVEGQTWPLELVTTALFAAWWLRARGTPRAIPLLGASAAAFALGALLIGIWAVVNGGVPEFSHTGII